MKLLLIASVFIFVSCSTENTTTEPMAASVKKGDVVIISTTVNNITVSVNGKSLSDGRIGEQIYVKNLKSGRVMEVIVDGPLSTSVK